ncbi:MAG: SUMF1/EgtB/PvdO family nonheme iron enzyme [Tepidisphaeraceae bacterium]
MVIPKLRQFLTGKRPTAIVAAFGKLRGYPDHIDAGSESPVILKLRQAIYFGGIAKCAGEWKRLSEAGKAIPFGHLVVYRNGNDAAALRILPSVDAVGRQDFPIVVCAQVTGLEPLAAAAARVVAVGDKMQSLKTRSDLTEMIRQLQQQLEVDLSKEELQVWPSRGAAAAAALFKDGSMGPDGEKLIQVVETLQDYISFSNGRSLVRTVMDRAEWVRVPATGRNTHFTAGLWAELLGTIVDTSHVSYFVIVPDNNQWADLIVGDPSDRQFWCLRAGLEEIPLFPNKSKHTDPNFRAVVRRFLEDLIAKASHAEPAAGIAEPAAAPAALVAETASAENSDLPVERGSSPAIVAGSPSPVSGETETIAKERMPEAASRPLKGAEVDKDITEGGASVWPNRRFMAIAGAAGILGILFVGTLIVLFRHAANEAGKVTVVVPTSTSVPEEPDPRGQWDRERSELRQDEKAIETIRAKMDQIESAFKSPVASSASGADDVTGVMDAMSSSRLGTARPEQLIEAADKSEKVIWSPSSDWPGQRDRIAEAHAELQHRLHDLLPARDPSFLPDLVKAVKTVLRARNPGWDMAESQWQKAVDKTDPTVEGSGAFPGSLPRIWSCLCQISKARSDLQGKAPEFAGLGTFGSDMAASWRESTDSALSALMANRPEERAPEYLEAAIEGIGSDAAQNAADLKIVPSNLALADQMLDQAYSIDERGSSGRTLLDIGHALGSIRDLNSGALAVIGSRLERIGKLREIAKSTDLSQLKQLVESGSDAALVAAAWRRWCQIAPIDREVPHANVEDDDDLKMLDSVTRSLSAAHLTEDRMKPIERLAVQRWVTRLEVSEATAGGIEYLLELKNRLGIGQPEVSERMQFNLALLRLKADLGVLNTGQNGSSGTEPAPATDGTILSRIDAFLQDVSKIGDQAAEVRELLSSLKSVREKAERLPNGFVNSADGKTASVTHNGMTLYFQKVPFDGTNASFYICTIECPVGLVRDVINEAHLPAEKIESLLDCAAQGQGPCGWKWVESTSSMELSSSWLEANRAAVVGDDSDLPAVTKWSPMQYVTPQAAQYVANQLGCRLPTQEEWNCASRMARGNGTQIQRGAAFRQYLQEYRNQESRDEGAARDDAGPFVDSFFVGNLEHVTTQAGQLWFHAEPIEARTLQNMVGNIAEWAYDGPLGMGIGPADLVMVHIMGQSIVSDPQGNPRSDTPSKDKGPLPKYEDVGFRMAFDDPAGTAVKQIRSALETAPFLQPARRVEGH